MLIVIIRTGLLSCILLTSFYDVFADHDDTKYSHLPYEIVVTADDWCPYTCTSSVARPGVMYELVKSVLNHADKEFNFKKVSWARAIESLSNDEAHVLLGVNPELASKAGFTTFKQFYLSVESAFLVHEAISESDFQEANFDDIKVGYMKYYQYDQSGRWDERLNRHSNSIELENHLGESHLITLLQKHRIDAALINIDVAKHYLEKRGLAHDYRFIRRDIRIPIYMAFNQSEVGEHILAMFSEQFELMQADGRLSVILQKYQTVMPHQDSPLLNLTNTHNPYTSE